MDTSAIEIVGLRKDYHGLRPLRLEHLRVAPGQIVVLEGLDAAAAEVLTNLLTGVSLPDEGDIRVFGEATSQVADAGAWLAFVDRFGIVSDRVVLLEALSVLQNLAVPLTLDLDPLSPDAAAAASRLAAEVGLAPRSLDARMAEQPPGVRLRAGLARAIALDPRILILEHPTLRLLPEQVPAFATDVGGLARRRGLTVLAASLDRRFADRVADRVLALQPATGRLLERGTWRRRLRRKPSG